MSESRPRILIVDDREQNRYILSRILRQAGYCCVERDRGAEALEVAQTLPEVIILDVRLPDMSGYEVCRKLKQDHRTAHVPILQISASFVSSEDKARALEAGADGYLIHPVDGTVLVATVRSLLRLRAAELMARKSAEQWQSAFDALSEGIAFVNAEGRLVQWNRAFDELCGENICLAPGDDALGMLEALLGTSEPLRQTSGKRYGGEFAMGHRTVQLSVNPVGVAGGNNGSVLVLNDITDRQLAEYALRTAEKIAAAGKLAHAIAHEINNPLEALTNLIYLAQGSEELGSVRGYLNTANDELARIARITKQTLSFHRDTRQPVPLDLGELLSEVVALFEHSAAARRVHVECDCHSIPTIYGYPGQLSQVFGNLVRNAAEAAPPETRVVVRVRWMKRSDRTGARVTIHNSGQGIPQHVQKKMFDPFFTTKELKGSGLGLWVSRSLVMRHRGTIRFRSSTRSGCSGTTFEVFLPVGGLDPQRVEVEEA